MGRRSVVAIGVLLPLVSTSLALAAGPHQMMRPRVPANKLEEARALRNPVPDSPETIEQGKALYEGKGICINCHGVTGQGNGPGAANLTPPPRNFRHRGFWRHRTEGEWGGGVIKNGSPGTAMIPFGGLLSDEEIWTIMQYERTFTGKGRGRRGGMGHMGPRDQGNRPF